MKRIILTILALGLGVFGVIFELTYSARFYPGVVIAGELVGGKSYEEVYEYFKNKSENFSKNGMLLIFEGERGKREVKVPISASGLTSDRVVEYFSLGNWEETILKAYGWGRDGFWPIRIKEQLTLLITGKKFNFPATPNYEAFQSLLSRELKNFFKEAVPAQFSVSSNKISISQEKIGESTSSEEVMGVVRKKLISFDVTPASFKTESQIPFTTEIKLRPFLAFAEKIASSTNLIFSYQDRKWKVSGKTLATWLSLKKGNRFGVDTEKLKGFLAKTVVPLIDNPPENSRFEMRSGKLVEIFPGKSGNIVNVSKTIERVEGIIADVQKSFSETDNLSFALASVSSQVNVLNGTIEIPVEIIGAEPSVTQKTVDRYKINDLVGFAKTSFKGSSQDRKHNIEIGVSKLTGLLIAPGEEFSAVEAIGYVTEAEGFVKEYVIKENRSIKELGGGLCQIATSLFRLALNAGLPITERQNHRYVVSYYGPGLDATIYGPHPDLRFINDTGNYILLQGKMENDDLIFEFYGQKDGRRVEISEPKLSDEKPAPETKYIETKDLPAGEVQCSETPRRGITADALYTVYYPGGEVRAQNFHSIYQPWQKICLIGAAQ